MFRKMMFAGCFFTLCGMASVADAQLRLPFVEIDSNPYGGVRVRAPFVRVETNRFGTSVRAPFTGVDARRSPFSPGFRPGFGPTLQSENQPQLQPAQLQPGVISPQLPPAPPATGGFGPKPAPEPKRPQVSQVSVEIPEGIIVLTPERGTPATVSPLNLPDFKPVPQRSQNSPEEATEEATGIVLPHRIGTELAVQLGEAGAFPNGEELTRNEGRNIEQASAQESVELSGPQLTGPKLASTPETESPATVEQKPAATTYPILLLAPDEKIPAIKFTMKPAGQHTVAKFGPSSAQQLTLTPMSLTEFPKQIAEVAGVHLVAIVHPISGRPIGLPLRLPAGKPKVTINAATLRLAYPTETLTLTFEQNGMLRLDTDQ